MNAFDKGRDVERIAREEILPWLLLKCDTVEATDSSEFLQKICGDFIVTQMTAKYGIELKAEARFTGNAYLETWSNRERMTPGWLMTSRARYLFYYFNDTKSLYIIELESLQRWAFGAGTGDGRIYKYPEKPQGKYDQLNDTWGRVVGFEELRRQGVKMKTLSVQEREAAIAIAKM